MRTDSIDLHWITYYRADLIDFSTRVGRKQKVVRNKIQGIQALSRLERPGKLHSGQYVVRTFGVDSRPGCRSREAYPRF